MSYFTQLLEGGYEAVHLLSDSRTGLKAIVGMHNTRLGPGLGGTRALSTYTSEEEAVADALRLARGMTYKAALAGLPHGGGKAVIMLPRGNFDRAKLFESFGRAVESLCGRYITTEDSGTSTDDMEHVRKHTKYVVGLKERSGDPSPVTAFGVARAMEATAKNVFGSADLKGLRVTVLGVGHVGMYLVKELHERGAKVWVSDINAASVEHAVKHYGATAVDADTLHRMEADVFAPCALGGAINDATLPLLKVKAVCGAANNQLLTMRHGEQLASRGILYVPDYAANAGGLINVAQEWAGYDREKAYARASNIFDTIDTLLRRAKESGQRPEQVADRMVEEKLSA
ncbi:Leu/Phe/Val dehydrogenase [Myxococcus landrumensis]|uniref:Glu/Leu/Phe/Val dehydrogenase n=1 Tax=Myxococcus landrumensis TaxID=2813577 RepID=A0ABX7MXH8_9BACT|nr:Glu/Leu/Phe/Val dehydrogenase [Myxococcus landrumus]QSQ10899.1 Glu/Leu/Phe/Val dehydrogenase [Myxococcus landrumus]